MKSSSNFQIPHISKRTVMLSSHSYVHTFVYVQGKRVRDFRNDSSSDQHDNAISSPYNPCYSVASVLLHLVAITLRSKSFFNWSLSFVSTVGFVLRWSSLSFLVSNGGESLFASCLLHTHDASLCLRCGFSFVSHLYASRSLYRYYYLCLIFVMMVVPP